MSNRSFSLTYPEPSPALVRRQRANSEHYANLALCHWLDAQAISHDLETAWDELTTVSNRLIAGDLWLRERGPSNPDWQRAQRQHARLHARQKELLGTVKFRYVSLWLSCCSVAGCLSSVTDPDGWIAEHAPGRFTADARSVWRAVQPDRLPPFTTMPPNEAYYIEPGRFETQEQLDAWMNREEG